MTDSFEKNRNDVEFDRNYGMEDENVIEFIRNGKTATVTFSQGRYISKVKKLAEKLPEKVEIIHEEDGLIVAHIPVSAIKINLTEVRPMTPEKREEAKQRLAEYRKKKRQEKGEFNDTEEEEN